MADIGADAQVGQQREQARRVQARAKHGSTQVAQAPAGSRWQRAAAWFRQRQREVTAGDSAYSTKAESKHARAQMTCDSYSPEGACMRMPCRKNRGFGGHTLTHSQRRGTMHLPGRCRAHQAAVHSVPPRLACSHGKERGLNRQQAQLHWVVNASAQQRHCLLQRPARQELDHDVRDGGGALLHRSELLLHALPSTGTPAQHLRPALQEKVVYECYEQLSREGVLAALGTPAGLGVPPVPSMT